MSGEYYNEPGHPVRVGKEDPTDAVEVPKFLKTDEEGQLEVIVTSLPPAGAGEDIVRQGARAASAQAWLVETQEPIEVNGDVGITVPASAQGDQVVVGPSAVQFASSPLALRKTISIKALAANSGTVYLGFSSAVSSSNGFELEPGDSIDLDVGPSVALWALATASDQRIAFIEVA